MMTRKDLDYAVVAVMLLSGVYVTASGLVAEVFGFPQFALHSTAGFVCAAAVGLHIIFNWKRVTAYLASLGRRVERAGRPACAAVGPRERVPQTTRRHLLIAGLATVGGFALGRLTPGRQTPARPDATTDVGELYHQWSKPGYAQVIGSLLNWGGQPARTKTYAGAPRIALPDPRGEAGLSLEEAVEARRSVRSYSAQALSPEALSRLLHAAQGITEGRGKLRAAPSAGALYPIELYAVVHNVTGLEPGLYHYVGQEHALELLQPGNLRAALVRAGLGQGFLGEVGVCFVMSAIFQRTRWRYHERTYRYVMLEAGHIGQNLYLMAVSLGLGACAVGAFDDDALNELVGLDGKEEAVLYAVAVGQPNP